MKIVGLAICALFAVGATTAVATDYVTDSVLSPSEYTEIDLGHGRVFFNGSVPLPDITLYQGDTLEAAYELAAPIPVVECCNTASYSEIAQQYPIESDVVIQGFADSDGSGNFLGVTFNLVDFYLGAGPHHAPPLPFPTYLGDYDASFFVGPAPEPTTWSLMMFGAAAIGASLRRRRAIAFP